MASYEENDVLLAKKGLLQRVVGEQLLVTCYKKLHVRRLVVVKRQGALIISALRYTFPNRLLSSP